MFIITKKLEVKCQLETSLDNCDGQPSKKGPVKTIITDMESCSWHTVEWKNWVATQHI